LAHPRRDVDAELFVPGRLREDHPMLLLSSRHDVALRGIVLVSAALSCGACARTAPPATATAPEGEEVAFMRNPIAPKGWIIYGKESRRVVAITDTIPDAQGRLAVWMLGRKAP
jgi:hypothetical protein